MERFDIGKELGIEKLVNTAGMHGVKAGILEGATNNESGENIAAYAAHNEFGTADIPSRPFLRKTFNDNSDKWAGGLATMLQNGRSPEQALKLLGMKMQDDIVKTIKSNMPPRNAPATIARKTKTVTKGGKTVGSHAPGTLIDTGSMLNAVNYEVF